MVGEKGKHDEVILICFFTNACFSSFKSEKKRPKEYEAMVTRRKHTITILFFFGLALVISLSSIYISSQYGIQEFKNDQFKTAFILPSRQQAIQKDPAIEKPIIKCNGTAKERRALVQNPFATPEDWEKMTQCVLEHQSQLKGHFSMHISKAGGTSICEAFKSKQHQCRKIPSRKERKKTKTEYNYNCWIGQQGIQDTEKLWQKQTFTFVPSWARTKVQKEMHLDLWMREGPNNNIIPCSTIENYFETEDNMVVFSENHLIQGKICQKGILNSIIIREPMSRLLSHYNDIYLWCMKNKYNPRCLRMLEGGNITAPGSGIYDTMFMANNFDFITNNIYTRSLNNNTIYYAPMNFPGMNSDEILSSALKSLQEMDWILVLGSGNPSERENNDLILSDGLGLGNGLPHSNKQGSKGKSNDRKISGQFTPDGRLYLEKLNALDYRIWEEAKKLHELDATSVHLMQKYGGHIIDKFNHQKNRTQKGDYCCGYMCKSPQSQ